MRSALFIAMAGASAALGVVFGGARAASAAPVPIARYTFDASAVDSAGSHNGTPQNGAAVVTSGAKVGAGALQLDGVDDFVSVVGNDGTTNFATLSNNYTIAAWVNPGRVTGVQRVFGNDRSTVANGFGFGLNNANLRHTTFAVKDYNQTGTTVPVNAWSHVAVVLDSANAATFYINGVNAGTVTHTLPGNLSTNQFVIGRTTGAGNLTASELYQGLVDDLQIFNTALAPGEVAALTVPEPAGLGLIAAAAAAGLLRRRRSV
jgi:hypothetical protein